MVRLVVLIPVALASAAALSIQSIPSALANRTKPSALSPSAKRGLAFATARCAGCHAVTAGLGSPNPEAPTFEAIANQAGLTGTTLRQFLSNSHNYPEAMNFKLERSAAGDLAAYIVTLKSASYRPAI